VKRTLFLLLFVAMASTGCSNTLTVRGIISNAATGQTISPCSVRIGERTAAADLAGRYYLQAWRRPPNTKFVPSHRDMEVLCNGYETKVIPILKGSRSQIVNVQMNAFNPGVNQ
jgi:hypothetical protein